MWLYVWTSEPKSIYLWTTPVKEVYLGTTKVRPEEKIIMSLADINTQSKFEKLTLWSNIYLLTVSWTNPLKYGYSSSIRYWGWQTKTDIDFPTKWEMFIDCIFWWHNRNSESFIGLITDIGWLGWQQGTLTTTTSNPAFSYMDKAVSPTSVNFMDGNRHTFKTTWDGWTYNARIDNTQILTNDSSTAPTNTTKFRFVVFGWSAYWIVQKSIYDFYVKALS